MRIGLRFKATRRPVWDEFIQPRQVPQICQLASSVNRIPPDLFPTRITRSCMADVQFQFRLKMYKGGGIRSFLHSVTPYQRCARPKVIVTREERAHEQFEASWLVSPMNLVCSLRSDKADATQTRA